MKDSHFFQKGFFKLFFNLFFLVTVFIAVGLVIFFSISGKQISLKSWASQNAPKIIIEPNYSTVTADRGVVVSLTVDPSGTKMTMASIKLKFDPKVLNLDSYSIASQLDVVRATPMTSVNKRGVILLDLSLLPNEQPIEQTTKVAELTFIKNGAVLKNVKTSITLDPLLSKEYFTPLGSVSFSTPAPLNLNVKGKPVQTTNLCLSVGFVGEGEDKRVSAKWKKSCQKPGATNYRVIIKNMDGTKASVDPANVGLVYSKIFDQTTWLDDGKYVVELTEVTGSIDFVQTVTFEVQHDENGVFTELRNL